MSAAANLVAIRLLMSATLQETLLSQAVTSSLAPLDLAELAERN